ncbi:MAG TPA: hypothetical protein VF598_14105, partial [Hymenobacter sp.]
MRFLYLVLLLSTLAQTVSAQTASDSAASTATSARPAKSKYDKPVFYPIPIAFYQQETGFAGGLAILPVWRFGSDTTVRKSNVRLIGWISQKKQTTLQLTHTIFTPQEKYFLSGELSYYDLAFSYYGIGNNTQKFDEVSIQYPLFVFDERALAKVVPNLFLGLRYRLTNLGTVDLRNEGDQANNPANKYYQLTAKERSGGISSGIGPAL